MFCENSLSLILVLQEGNSALILAAVEGKADVVKILLDHGAAVDLPGEVMISVLSCMFRWCGSSYFSGLTHEII